MTMKKRILSSLCLLVAATIGTWAQGPNNSGTYYKNADGKSGSALKTALYGIISKQAKTPSYDNFIQIYKTTDTRADGKVRDWYSNATNYVHEKDKAGSYKQEGDVYNREHLVPQDWGASKAGDVTYVVPTDGYVNGKRSNWPFGEVKNPTYQSENGYSKVGPCATQGYTGTVFEPNDEVKGDIARIYFYMTTRYETTCTKWSGAMFTGTSYQPLAAWAYDMLLRWSKLDPIDDVEIARNNAIARTDIQGNRNPFVDYPGLEDYIWGDKMDVPFSYDNYDSGDSVIAERVAQPVFSPADGTYTDSVVVTITCATDSAVIYYTTDGSNPTEASLVYIEPVMLTETTTLKAIAMKDSLRNSFLQEATYVIRSSQPGTVTAEEVDFALNNVTFGTTVSGALSGSALHDYTATKDGITVTYAKGSGTNMYMNDKQIRLYGGNSITVSSDNRQLAEMEFTLVLNKDGKTMQCTTGTISDLAWSGPAQSVTFSVNSGSGHMQLSQLKVKLTASDKPTQPVAGDVNGDGSVDVADIAAVISVMAGDTLGEERLADAADVNGDGSVDVADIAAIISIMAGETVRPAE